MSSDAAQVWSSRRQSALFTEANIAARPVITKLILLACKAGLAAYATHRLLPRLTPEGIGAFAVHAWSVTARSILMLIVGVGIRMGGLF